MESVLFNPIKIRNLEIKNRFVRSATFEGLGSPGGFPSFELGKHYAKLADGDVGLIISTSLIEQYKNKPDSDALSYPLRFDYDRYIVGWSRIIASVHKRRTKIAMQLMHPGRQEIYKPGGSVPVAPSSIPKEEGSVLPVELKNSEIIEYIEKFAQAGRRVMEAGFDAVQLHGAHGYLISNFLSPHANHRIDQYGGSTENRARFVIEIVKRMRELIGSQFPIMLKMNFNDFLQGGLEPEEAVRLAVIFEQSGIDSIEVSGGTSAERWRHVVVKNIRKEEDESYFQCYSSLLKSSVKIPVMLVGGHRTFAQMQKLVENGVCDLLSMSRPFIKDPYLIRKFKNNETEKSDCISCNLCFKNIFKHPAKCWKDDYLKNTYG